MQEYAWDFSKNIELILEREEFEDVHLCGYIWDVEVSASGTNIVHEYQREYDSFELGDVTFEVISVYPDVPSDDPQPLDADEVLKDQFIKKSLEMWCKKAAEQSSNWTEDNYC